MPKKIYNEGRVVGYSAYEIYVKNSMIDNPGQPVMSESEWLTAMFLDGTSMLLKIGTDNISGPHYRDIQFPTNSNICAATTITAHLFNGEGYIGDNVDDTDTNWCTKVTSYGSLIKNNEGISPIGTLGNTGSIPPSDNTAISDTVYMKQVSEYLKIVDGIIIQPGTWTATSSGQPGKDFTPDLSTYPRLRISFSDKIEKPFYILLTGFVNRTVVSTISNLNGSTNTESPEDGDYLGPAVYPWVNKVIFSIPNSFLSYSNHVVKQMSDALSTALGTKLSEGETKHYHISVNSDGVSMTEISAVLVQFLESINIEYGKLAGTQNDFLIRMDGNGVTLKPHV